MRNTYAVVLFEGLFLKKLTFSPKCVLSSIGICAIWHNGRDVCVLASVVLWSLFIPQLFVNAIVWKGLKPAPAPTADHLRAGHPQANDQPTGTSGITIIFRSVALCLHCLSSPCSFQPSCRFETYDFQSTTALIHCIFSWHSLLCPFCPLLFSSSCQPCYALKFLLAHARCLVSPPAQVQNVHTSWKPADVQWKLLCSDVCDMRRHNRWSRCHGYLLT